MSETDRIIISEILLALRESHGVTYREIVRRSKELKKHGFMPITRKQLKKWEKGLTMPDVEQLATLIEIFDLPVGYFFAGDLKILQTILRRIRERRKKL